MAWNFDSDCHQIFVNANTLMQKRFLNLKINHMKSILISDKFRKTLLEYHPAYLISVYVASINSATKEHNEQLRLLKYLKIQFQAHSCRIYFKNH